MLADQQQQWTQWYINRYARGALDYRNGMLAAAYLARVDVKDLGSSCAHDTHKVRGAHEAWRGCKYRCGQSMELKSTPHAKHFAFKQPAQT